MSILRMDNFGNIVEDNGEGEIRTAEMVADDNVAKLSVKEDAQVVSDRANLKKIDDINTQLAAKQAADITLIKAAQEKHQRDNADRMHALKTKMAYLQELKKSIKIAQAVLQGRNNSEYEKMSGVTGYGFTADGRRPEQSMSHFDYAPIVDVDSAFGSFGIDGDPVGFEKLSSSHQDQIRRYVLADNPVFSGNVDGVPFSMDVKQLLAAARANPEASIIDLQEYDAAKQRGWGTLGYITKEGTKWTWWPYQVPFHPNVLFFKNITGSMASNAVVPKEIKMYGIMLQPLNNAFKQNIVLTSSQAPAVAPITTPVVVAPTPAPVVSTPVVTPAPAVVEQIQQVKQQEAIVDKAIEQTQKAIEAQITTQQAVQAATVPTTVAEAKKTLGVDYRHPMLSFGLVQKTAPLSAKKEKLLFGLGRPNYALHGKGSR